MSILTNPELIKLVICPACGGDLSEFKSCLRCSRCSTEYEVRKGIPLLYLPTMNAAHLREEEKLATMMKRDRLNSRDKFILTQWEWSKVDFWSMVESHIQPNPPQKLFINIGCGYDSSFRRFEQRGDTFINFDMTYDMLDTLQSNYEAKSCVAGDVNNLPFKKGIFDYVVSIDVIHHESNNLRAILQSFQDLLKPGGSLFLEDPNAWGMFQMTKSVVLPKPLYRFLRQTYHNFKRSVHRPADYEFPTNVWQVKAMLDKLGFQDIKVHSNNAYPCIGETGYRLYKLFCRSEYIRKFHNYHYMVSCKTGKK